MTITIPTDCCRYRRRGKSLEPMKVAPPLGEAATYQHLLVWHSRKVGPQPETWEGMRLRHERLVKGLRVNPMG